ncbi:MAG TPA: heparinase II/III family protein [Puia sp.]|nr:heparinase II/III family protein [Puia sp.]
MKHVIFSFSLASLLGICGSLSLLGQAQSSPASSSAAGGPGQERNYLSRMFDPSGFRLTKTSLENWREARKKDLAQKITALPDSIKAVLIKRANSSLTSDWSGLSAEKYNEFKATGNRSNYESKVNQHRTAVYSLAIGEMVTHDPKYLAPLVQGLLATLGEATWVLPAHQNEVIDLIAGETAAGLADIEWMLSAELEQASPGIGDQIRAQISQRILVPYLQHTDFWWMGFGKTAPNNWNPWINSNVLNAVVGAGMDADTANLVLAKVLHSTDRFINGYPEDGGCEEGPQYWSAAGGKLIRVLDLVRDLSGNKLSVSTIPLLHRMGTYIYKMHIADDYFVNFGDATPRTIPFAESVFQFGTYFGDDTLRGFGAFMFSLKKNAITTEYLPDFLYSADLFNALSNSSPQEPGLSIAWMPDLQILTARSEVSNTGELFLAVQAGNNGKSHNHNDVGNFIIYVNDRPVIVDAGVGTYVATTFSKDRYTLWNLQSQWHNCPLINGIAQKDGKQFKAGDLTFDQTADHIRLSMDVAGAYPPEANVKVWKRDFQFNTRINTISMDESYELGALKDTTCDNFLTSCTIRKIKDGQLAFVDGSGKDILIMTYDPVAFDVQTTYKLMDDVQLKKSWGDHLWRVSCITKNNSLKSSNKVVFSLPVAK